MNLGVGMVVERERVEGKDQFSKAKEGGRGGV